MIIRNNIAEAAYNAQATVDSKHSVPIGYKVTNTNGSKAMGNMPRRAKSILRSNEFTALYDKGHHTGTKFDITESPGIDVMVAIPATPKSSQAPGPAYNIESFQYNEKDNTYTCPQGQVLATDGSWHKSKGGSWFQQYRTGECQTCPVREKCTKSEKNGKIVQRRKYAQNIEANKQRIEDEKDTYKKRQAIVEHPYGTIKRQWGFSYIITKKYLQRAGSDVGLMMTAYNLRGLINIVGISCFKGYLEQVISLFLTFWVKIGLKSAHISNCILQKLNCSTIFGPASNRLFLTQKLEINGSF
jgi:hypothetical protein